MSPRRNPISRKVQNRVDENRYPSDMPITFPFLFAPDVSIKAKARLMSEEAKSKACFYAAPLSYLGKEWHRLGGNAFLSWPA